MSRFVNMTDALQVALTELYPERKRFDLPLLVERVVERSSSTAELLGTWSGMSVSASVTEVGEDCYLIALCTDHLSGYRFHDVDLSRAGF